MVFLSYRQTIDAYPHGGGSYTVASENLGETAGLLAAAALMIDYIPQRGGRDLRRRWSPGLRLPRAPTSPLALCLAILLLLTLINIMRGVKDTGSAFLHP